MMHLTMGLRRWFAPGIAGALLVLPALAGPALAAAATPPAAASRPGAAGNRGGQMLLSSDILGGGVITDTQGAVALFQLRAGATARSAHGGNFSWVEQDGSEGYNGAIRDYSVNGGTATISGGGPLFDKNGVRRRVRFTVTITPGGSGTATMNMTFTGQDFNMQCQDTVQSGLIAFGPLGDSTLQQLKDVQPSLVQLRQGLLALRGQVQSQAPQPVPAGSAS